MYTHLTKHKQQVHHAKQVTCHPVQTIQMIKCNNNVPVILTNPVLLSSMISKRVFMAETKLLGRPSRAALLCTPWDAIFTVDILLLFLYPFTLRRLQNGGKFKCRFLLSFLKVIYWILRKWRKLIKTLRFCNDIVNQYFEKLGKWAIMRSVVKPSRDTMFPISQLNWKSWLGEKIMLWTILHYITLE